MKNYLFFQLFSDDIHTYHCQYQSESLLYFLKPEDYNFETNMFVFLVNTHNISTSGVQMHFHQEYNEKQTFVAIHEICIEILNRPLFLIL